MSGFSAAWLALREPVDHRSRNRELASALSARFHGHPSIEVVDLGCGTGSNLRATADLLPSRQSWTLVDYDPALLQAAREALTCWADTAIPSGEALALEKGGRHILVRFRRADLNADLDAALGARPELVTASAFFDLCSARFVSAFARAVAKRRAVFYTVLTYNGIQRFTPRHPSDGAMIAAFHAHQATDKGFGSAAGPSAPAHLADAFRLEGYSVQESDSPWVLGPSDAELLSELTAGFAGAVRETGQVDQATLDRWLRAARTGAHVGHTDTLATPPT
jgi:SAM-dependent methyltransferase